MMHIKELVRGFLPKSITCLFKERYTGALFVKDLVAGLTVGVIAFPLAMALGIASGVTPEQGLFTAIVAGFLISLLGGSRVQIGGPTGAFVVIVYTIVQREGYSGLVIATLLAGFLLIGMGLCRLGTWIKYIPYPLVTGFTAGIALILFSSQVKDVLGLQIGEIPADFLLKWQAILHALPSWNPWACGVGLFTLLLIVAIRRFYPRIPWGIFPIIIVTFLTWVLHLPIETIGTCYGTIPRMLPSPSLPEFSFNLTTLQHVVPDAITIAFLAGVESLLSAVIADGMTGRKHASNMELIAQGFANIGACFFGGIPATGAIARTATNVKTGGKTPIAGMVHAVTILLILLLFAPYVRLVPLSSLAAVLIMIAWNMSEREHFRHLFKAPLGDIAILLSAFFLTVLVDLTVAVEVGMILAAFLFMKRMSEMARVVPLATLLREEDEERQDSNALWKQPIPMGVEVYEIEGPFFFGAADTLQNLLHNLERPPKVFILRMRKVPVIDASGLHALNEFHAECQRSGAALYLSEVDHQLLRLMRDYGIEKRVGKEHIFSRIEIALQYAQKRVE